MTIKYTLLGSGSSLGVPRPDGYFGNCDPTEKKNYRTRCSFLISSKIKNIIIDTSPDLRIQLLNNKVKNINAVFYTHYHADQTHGINDLRVFFLKSNKKIPVYSDLQTKKFLFTSFKYCFNDFKEYPSICKHFKLKKIHLFDSKKNKIKIQYLKVKHGLIDALGYLINDNCAYISDVSEIYEEELKKLRNLKYFVVDCLRFKEHSSHFNLNQVLNIIKYLKPKKTILTNLHSDIDYNKLKIKLPKNIVPGYDGLSFYI